MFKEMFLNFLVPVHEYAAVVLALFPVVFCECFNARVKYALSRINCKNVFVPQNVPVYIKITDQLMKAS